MHPARPLRTEFSSQTATKVEKLFSGTQADRDEAHLDFVLAGAHGFPSHITSVQAFIEHHHRAQMAAVTRHPWIDVIVHPWTPRKRLERASIAWDWCFSRIPEAMLAEWADALAGDGRWEEAARELHAARLVPVDLDPEGPPLTTAERAELMARQAAALLELERSEEAAELVDRALELDPDCEVALELRRAGG